MWRRDWPRNVKMEQINEYWTWQSVQSSLSLMCYLLGGNYAVWHEFLLLRRTGAKNRKRKAPSYWKCVQIDWVVVASQTEVLEPLNMIYSKWHNHLILWPYLVLNRYSSAETINGVALKISLDLTRLFFNISSDFKKPAIDHLCLETCRLVFFLIACCFLLACHYLWQQLKSLLQFIMGFYRSSSLTCLLLLKCSAIMLDSCEWHCGTALDFTWCGCNINEGLEMVQVTECISFVHLKIHFNGIGFQVWGGGGLILSRATV